MKQSPPEVSLGMPVYNGEMFLEETLDAILKQSFQDWELVISDNASTDRTQEICRSFAARDTRISYSRLDTNLGAAQNYNRVFELSGGRYFKWAAADDVFLPSMISTCYQRLEQEPEAVLCFPETRIIDGRGETVSDYDDNLTLDSPSPSVRFKEFMQLVGECNAVFGLIRRDVLARTRLIGNFIGSDVSLLAELSLYGRFIQVPGRLFLRREHADASSCNKEDEKQLEFFDPELQGKFVSHEWRHSYEHARAVLRAPISPQEKVRALFFILRWIVWSRGDYIREVQQAVKSIGRA